MTKLTPWVFMWETPDGERHWEAIEEAQREGFCQKLIEQDKVDPATVMVAYLPITFHFLWKQYHNGLDDVNFGKINETIYGSEPTAVPAHKPVDVPCSEPEPAPILGWLAPDGRHFACEYGDHTSLARQIVGEMEDISDPEQHLERKGWAKIYRDPIKHCDALGMGMGHALTDAQFKMLTRMGIENIPGVSNFLVAR